jgi:rhodanese-related sulfurtransferase
VRTPVEYRAVHATSARNIPFDRLKPADISRAHPQGDPVYVICQSGGRSRKACEALATAGVQAIDVSGGTLAWEEAGLPVVVGVHALSLERQVRIAAGFLALTGAVLALTVHPYFAGLSAFIGAGLIFAGITDTCGMGMILARMPWNQVREAKPQAACETTGDAKSGGCCG